MRDERNYSSSEQYIKKTNRKLLLFGLVLVFVFILALMSVSGTKQSVKDSTPLDFRTDDFNNLATGRSDMSAFPRGSAQLKVTPENVVMDNVVLGSNVESVVTLTAINAPIYFLSTSLAEEQQDGFKLDTTCVPEKEMQPGETCNIKVLWNPVSLMQLQNNLTITWRENNPAVFRDEKTVIQIKATSTDSKDCVICENAASEASKKTQYAMGMDGNLYPVNEDGTVTINGKNYKITEDGLVIDENGQIAAIIEPKKIPLGLDHKILGTISDTQDVIDANGKKIGRLLGDDTIVDSATLTVVGAAVPVVSVMDENGAVIGKMLPEGVVVDASGNSLGRPLVDGSVINANNQRIGTLRPWGLVVGFDGFIMGGITPDGYVTNAKQQKVALIKPNGFAVNPSNELIGSVVTRGVAVGAGCQGIGEVLLNGQVRDSYEQVIGRQLPDGAVVDNEGNEIGSVVSQGLVINEKGIVQGFVNSEGKAVNAKGSVIGCVNPDGTVMAGKKSVGAVMAKGRVVGYGCQLVGSVYPNGVVVNDALDGIARVLADRFVKDRNNQIIGVVVPRGTAIAEGCRLLGMINLSGRVISQNNQEVACINVDSSVIDPRNGVVVGAVTHRGVVVDKDGKVLGRVRLDGKVINDKGVVIGCVNPDGTVSDLKGNIIGSVTGVQNGRSQQGGVILDANGNPTDLSVVGNKVYDKSGNYVGDLQENGWVTDEKGVVMAVIPPDGVIFSPEGLILGRYSQKSGVAVDMEGNRFGRVLPDLTVVSGESGEIIGALFADKTTFMNLDGSFLAMMRVDGRLIAGTGDSLAIRADGSVVDKTGKIVGVRIPTGTLLGVQGGIVGSVKEDGRVVSRANTQIGRILGNGIAINDEGKILGGIFSEVSIPFGSDGEPMGSITLQGKVIDANGREVGSFSPFGVVYDTDGKPVGELVRVGSFINNQNKAIGTLSFKGELTGNDGRSVARVLSNGLALNKSNEPVGSLVKRGSVISSNGTFVGTSSVNGVVLGKATEVLGTVKSTDYFFGPDGQIAGMLAKPGVAVDLNGAFLGVMDYTGDIKNQNQTVGNVGLDGQVYDKSRKIIGSYIPFDAIVMNEMGQSVGSLNASGLVSDAKGAQKGAFISPIFMMTDGVITGRIFKNTDMVTRLYNGSVQGQIMPDGTVMSVNDNKPIGSVLMSGLVNNLTKQVVGGVVMTGAPFKQNLSVLGEQGISGTVFDGNKTIASTLPNGGLFDLSGKMTGHIGGGHIFIGREGAVIGTGTGSMTIVSKDGKKLASYMPFGSALTTDNLWAGGIMPNGMVVNDDAFTVGAVALDGAVVDRLGAVKGRVLSDGSVAGISARDDFAIMPYVGGIVRQGLPIGYKGDVLGRTTITGDVVDAADKKAYRILDDGTILGGDMPLAGAVITLTPAIAQQGGVMGSLTGNGEIVSFNNDVVGKIAANETVKKGKFKVLGRLVAPKLVANDSCQIVGQVDYDGRVVNGAGAVVGRMLVDQFVEDTKGAKIGHVVRTGIAISNAGDYMGRLLPDSNVVDTSGTQIGCSRMDGSIVDAAGNVIGQTVERGLVLDENGNSIGRIKASGTVVDKKGNAIGKVLADGSVVDKNNQKIGWNTGRDSEIIVGADGAIEAVIKPNNDGTQILNTKGETIAVVRGDTVYTPDGVEIGRLNDEDEIVDKNGTPISGPGSIGLLRTKDGKIMGMISGCDILNPEDHTKIATITPEGTVLDLNGGIYAVIGSDGTLFDAAGEEIGSLEGMGIDLTSCGVELKRGGSAAYGSVSADAGRKGGRRIVIGDQLFDVNARGSIVDSDGTIIGYMGEDGRPYALNNKPLSIGSDGQITSRTRPDLDKKMQPSEEQALQMQQLLAQRRAQMKEARQSPKAILSPSARILARAKKKQDDDWGEPKIVSSWPVDMSRMILKDKAIPAVLVHSLDSRFADVPATAIVERHIYTESGRNIIIPAGSRLIGKMSGGGGSDQVSKVNIVWERLIRPDGSAFKFSAASGDAQGRGGVASYLDNELVKKFSNPLLVSLATNAMGYMIATTGDTTTNSETGMTTQSNSAAAADDARRQFLSDMNNIFEELIDDATNIPSVLFVPSGTRLTVFPNEDLWLRTSEEDEKDFEEQFGENPTAAQKAKTGSWLDKRQSTNATPQQAAQQYYEPNDAAYPQGEILYDEGMEQDTDTTDEEPDTEPAPNPNAGLEDRVVQPVLPSTQNNSKAKSSKGKLF